MYDQTVTWHQPETAPVTPEQIQEEQQRMQQAYDWAEYKRNRAREYPTIQEQLDALYHAGVFPAEMAARIRAVKAKYPRYSPDQAQTAEQTVTPTMSVEAWLAQESAKTTADQWLAQQQQSATPMTREQWLASQVAIKTPHNAGSTSDVARTMTTQEWLAEQTQMTPEQWLAQQQSATPMTREQWLASQVEVKTVHTATPTNLVTVTRTMTTEEWLREQAALNNTQTITREQWLEQQNQQDQPRKLTREEWLAEQATLGD